ncbi:MAG: MerR family transcriptional regulator [Elusimicrobia bacterium]|nr:MerR family transcriptional regulator [Elusimicrobiota bacterium]
MTLGAPPPLFPDQKYFSPSQASRIVQIPEYTLRYWESRLRLPRPMRRESGHRRYTPRDLKLLLRIKELVQERRMTLEGARKFLLSEGRGRAAAPACAVGGDAAKVIREVREELRGLLSDLSD